MGDAKRAARLDRRTARINAADTDWPTVEPPAGIQIDQQRATALAVAAEAVIGIGDVFGLTRFEVTSLVGEHVITITKVRDNPDRPEPCHGKRGLPGLGSPLKSDPEKSH